MATTALALIGLFNVFGTYVAGSLGQRLPKRYLLSTIYSLRSVAIVVFLLAPLTPWSVYVFAAAMGFLWLSTVPLDQRHRRRDLRRALPVDARRLRLPVSHQVGSFLGVWLGGRLYDATGSYDIVWWIAVALGVFAALVNLPIRERAIARPAHRMRPGTRSRALGGDRASPLAAVFAAYQRPDLAVDLANRLWACF